MSFKIKNVNIDSPIILAPMAGVSNIAYRKMCKKYGVGLCVSEMISDKGIFYKDAKTFSMMQIDESEHPFAMQIFGGDIDTLLYAAKYVDTQTNADIIDINMGCPVPKVIKNHAGSYYLLDVNNIYKTVKTIVENVKKPVSVKIRIGWDHQSINVFEVVDAIIRSGASAITIHGRTKSDLYSNKVRYDLIKAVKEKYPSFPIIANGDITSAKKAKEVLEYTKCDGIMIGRATYGNPYIIKQMLHYIQTDEILEDMNLADKIEILMEYTKDLIQYVGENTAMKLLRGQAGWFIKNCRNSAKYRNRLSSISTLTDLNEIVTEILKEDA